MIYKFTYLFNDRLFIHTCYDENDALSYFALLLNLRCDSIRIDTRYKNPKKY